MQMKQATLKVALKSVLKPASVAYPKWCPAKPNPHKAYNCPPRNKGAAFDLCNSPTHKGYHT